MKQDLLSGFTLIEVVITLTLLSLIGAGLTTSFFQTAEMMTISSAKVGAEQEAEAFLIKLTRELRHAHTVENLTLGLAASSITFVRDPNSYAACGSCQDRSPRITYRLDRATNTLLRKSDAGSYRALGGVTRFEAALTPGGVVTFSIDFLAAPPRPDSSVVTLSGAAFMRGEQNKSWREVTP